MENRKIGTGLLIGIIGLIVSILSCIAAWIMIPGIGEFFFQANKAETEGGVNTNIPEEATPTEEIEIMFEPTQAVPDPENLINNGYFLDDFDGWQRELVDEGGSSKISIINFGSSLFNRALHIEHEGLGEIYFYQDVDIPSTDLVFSCSFNASSTEGPIIGFSGTGFTIIGIVYLDSQNNSLGFTRIINFNESLFAGTSFVGAPEELSDTNTTHNYEVESGNTYADFTIDINKELNNNLLGIDPTAVDAIEIMLIVGSTDSSASAELTISDIVLKEK